MINRSIAKEYIDTLGQFPAYQITIFDSHGNIVCSTQNAECTVSLPELQNFIHSADSVFQCIKGDLHCVLIKVFEDDQISCCIEIAGIDNNILPIATALKMSLEVRVKYDKIQSKEKETLTINEQLIQELIADPINVSKIIDLCEQSHHSIETARRLMIFIPDDPSSLDSLINMNLYYDSKEDIIGRHEKSLVILKDMNNADESEKEYVRTYINFLVRNTSFKGKVLVSYTSPSYYNVRFSYQALMWLKKQMFTHTYKESILFLSDFIDLYFLSQIPFEIYQNMFQSYMYDEDSLREFVQTTDALIKNNYNIVRSSKDLYVHKNTLMYRLSKIKKEFDIDPINSEADRSFVKFFNYYLKYLLDVKGGLQDERNSTGSC